MRISSNTIYELGIASMQQQTSALVHTQQQLASGTECESLAVPAGEHCRLMAAKSKAGTS